ncbi:MAG: AraC family transcriptional regulator [Planctomycetes bacterium]|nr:AraC family transcriptional regulator [Planctomycetota bacterium]
MTKTDQLYFPEPADDAIGRRFRVFSLGHGDLRKDEEVSGRRHPRLDEFPSGFAVLQFTIAGRGHLRTRDGKHITIGKNMGLCLKFPGDFSYGASAGENWQRIWISLVGETALDLVGALATQSGLVFKGLLQSNLSIMQRMIAAAEKGQSSTQISTLAFSLINQLSAQQAPGDRSHPPAIAAALAVVRRRINDASLTVDDLCAAGTLSRAHFSRLFQSHVGTAPMQHIIQRRLRRAANMLQHAHLSINEIVTTCGFPSRQRLHQAFTQTYGMSPRAWRKQQQHI